MRYFDYSKIENMKFDVQTINLLSSIHEAKIKNIGYVSTHKDDLERLIETAKVQSVSSSNAIEGITTTNARLTKLVKEKVEPTTRDEREIAGYRDALNVINESYEHIKIDTNHILQIHRIMYRYVPNCDFAGKLKRSQNYIQGIDKNGIAYSLFTPLPPYETQLALDNICEEYNKAVEKSVVDPLLLIPIFIRDFLCIHPFEDGNGRTSRLLTVLLLYKAGYFVSRYMSLEERINKIKDLYYDSLMESQNGWQEGKDDPSSFIKYLLSIISMSYTDLNERIDLVKDKKPMPKIVEQAFEKQIGKVTKSEIYDYCLGVSYSAVEKAIAQMVKDNKLDKFGNGKNTYYVKK